MLKNIYVGNLYVPKNSVNNSKMINIDISKYNDINKYYDCFLTLFEKKDNEYICLHDKKIYNKKGTSFVVGLIPFSNYIIKYDRSNLNTEEELLYFFDKTFNTSSIPRINQNYRTYKLQDIYICSIIINTSKKLRLSN